LSEAQLIDSSDFTHDELMAALENLAKNDEVKSFVYSFDSNVKENHANESEAKAHQLKPKKFLNHVFKSLPKD